MEDHWRPVSFFFPKSWHQLKADTAHLDERFLQHIRLSATFDICWGGAGRTFCRSLCCAPFSQVLTGTHCVKRDIRIICRNSLQISVLSKGRTTYQRTQCLVALLLSCWTRVWNTKILWRNRERANSCSSFFKTAPHL